MDMTERWADKQKKGGGESKIIGGILKHLVLLLKGNFFRASFLQLLKDTYII